MEIITPETRDDHDNRDIVAASPEMFKAFWPEVRGSYFFRSRRLFLDFMRAYGGRIYFPRDVTGSRRPFILVGNWRSRSDITAMWHIKGEGPIKRRLVTTAAARSFGSGSDAFVTKPLAEYEAEEYGKWGFEPAYGIVLFEMQLRRDPVKTEARDGVEITRYKKKYLGDVLRVDTTAFDDFWQLDARTLEAIATTCYHNVFLLAQRGGEILGYAVGGTNGRFGYLQRLGVDSSHHGEGLGGALVRQMVSTLQNMGATSVMVNTQEENVSAIGLYLKIGFEILPDRRQIMRCIPRDLEPAR
ncbi:MAG: GNAT family N-acetyltransferase [Actinomycetota bacterium]